ncbi:MAG: NTP transferase domain-containing protein [Lachnospiraceae bacterium]
MQAIIMAAGKGSRLGELTEEMPKSFLEIRGIKLIEYNVALLHAFDIKDIVIVTGYMTEKIEEWAADKGITCVYNPFFEMTNVLGSFYMGQEHLNQDVIYMHADTLAEPAILEQMLKADGDIVLPVDHKKCDEEAMKVLLQNNEIVQISKLIPCEKAAGEFIGIARINQNVLPALKRASKEVLKRKNYTAYFEAAIQELINERSYSMEILPTDQYFWAEIDFAEDYARAKAEITEALLQVGRGEFGK